MLNNSSERRVHRRERRAGQVKEAKVMSPILYIPSVFNLLDEEGVERIHQASLRILSEFGIAFYDEEAQSILKAHGVRLEGDIAYFDPGLVEEYVSKAPRGFTQLARNVANNLEI